MVLLLLLLLLLQMQCACRMASLLEIMCGCILPLCHYISTNCCCSGFAAARAHQLLGPLAKQGLLAQLSGLAPPTRPRVPQVLCCSSPAHLAAACASARV
jgi:hypothetical protein